ncbi:glycerophosphodiester phosphodiesterase 1 isoform X1 [Elephas maximus indicus]|uniref:glycerophosphodiester phosphodiesterase 1 isoform X1 n=1 Tax=Elephas maximus indicus TaxID=99487 RepID=UPI002116F42C|nr:glycerophosphodiester phosphodiesterase 1 isoform X1 [Elephas maximus indicus]
MWLWEEQGGLLGPFSFLLLLLLLATRSPFNACLLTGGLYVLLRLFSFEPVPSLRALQVLKPRGRVSAIAHRGGGHDAPENTLAAIRQAAKNGATGVELDLEFTSDGIPVLMHDSTVDRTTDGTGRLCDLTFEQIRKLNPAANHRLRNDFPDEKIPTLREAVAECLNHNLTIYFDVKGHANMATVALKKAYLEFPQLYNNSIVCSFLPDVIYKAHSRSPGGTVEKSSVANWKVGGLNLMRQADRNVVTALTHRPWSLSYTGDGKPRYNSVWKQSMFVIMDILLDWSMHNILWYLCGISAFLMQKDFVSPAYLNKWSAKGIQVVGWTVNTFEEKSYYESYLASSYITDSMLEDCAPQF